jgi:hypothetical protein
LLEELLAGGAGVEAGEHHEGFAVVHIDLDEFHAGFGFEVDACEIVFGGISSLLFFVRDFIVLVLEAVTDVFDEDVLLVFGALEGVEIVDGVVGDGVDLEFDLGEGFVSF